MIRKAIVSLLLLVVCPSFSQIVEEYQTRCGGWPSGPWNMNQNCVDSDVGFGTFSVLAEGKISCSNDYVSPVSWAGVEAQNCQDFLFLEATARKKPDDVGDRIECAGAAFNSWGQTLWVMNDFRWCTGTRYVYIQPDTPC